MATVPAASPRVRMRLREGLRRSDRAYSAPGPVGLGGLTLARWTLRGRGAHIRTSHAHPTQASVVYVYTWSSHCFISRERGVKRRTTHDAIAASSWLRKNGKKEAHGRLMIIGWSFDQISSILSSSSFSRCPSAPQQARHRHVSLRQTAMRSGPRVTMLLYAKAPGRRSGGGPHFRAFG